MSDSTHLSPSGKYRLEVEFVESRPGCWNTTVARVYEGDRLVIEVERNYHSFPHSWVEGHPNGHDYLICGSDYQGQTFVELDTGKRKDHLPHSAKKGHGFCWSAHHPSPDGTLLAVEGCYWACPYEVRIYDFSNPMADHLPLLLYRQTDMENFDAWIDDDSCHIGYAVDAVNAPGHPLHGKTENELDMEDLDALTRLSAERGIDEDDLFEMTFTREVTWVRPSSWLDQAREILRDLAWTEGYSGEEDPDGQEALQTIMKRLTEEERITLQEETPNIVAGVTEAAQKERARIAAAMKKWREKRAQKDATP